MNAVAHGSLLASSLFSVANKVCLVTGGSRGIGHMIAQALVHNGARVYIASRSEQSCARAAAALSSEGPGSCIGLPAADVSTEAGCRALAAAVAAREQALHVLVNNSGTSWGAPLDSFPEEQFDKVFALNVKAPFLLTRACRQLLLAGSRGSSRAAAGGEAELQEADPSRVIMIGSIVSEAGEAPLPLPLPRSLS